MNLTVKDVARMFRVSQKTIYRWVASRSIPFYRVQDQYRFDRGELLEWANTNHVELAPQVLLEESSVDVPLPGVAQALRDGGIYYRVSGSDRETVLCHAVDLLHLPEGVDRRFLTEVLLAREALASTGVCDGIAIPHTRHPVVQHLRRPVLALCFLEHPVDFGALDGKPVYVLFLLVSPTTRQHLHLLSRLAFVLRNATFRAVLERQALREEIVAAAEQAEAAAVVET